MTVILFYPYFSTNTTFIWKVDGKFQHYNSLLYFSRYLRGIGKNLLQQHKLIIPQWDFALGEGGDIFQTLSYYVICDPFALGSVLCPASKLWLYYDLMILLRIYLAGLAFSSICFYTQKSIPTAGVLTGAVCYVFCHWTLFCLCKHPFFLNPLLYLPLILLGVEKVIRKERSALLVVMVFLAGISNFYYFYDYALLTAAYVILRLWYPAKKDKNEVLPILGKLFTAALLGACMAAVILLPEISAFLSDGRMGSGTAWHLFYPLSYYAALPGALFTGEAGYYLYLGYSAPVVLGAFLLLRSKKEHSVLKGCLLLTALFCLIPAAGQVLNGMSYMCNRWCFAAALAACFAFSAVWEKLMAPEK
ncbi:MAG: YfhO family protein, partial [Lachnospiraceae bacterium]|nr:YfhO family protein [Lachnospiraceae bacterium]